MPINERPMLCYFAGFSGALFSCGRGLTASVFCEKYFDVSVSGINNSPIERGIFDYAMTYLDYSHVCENSESAGKTEI